MEKKPNVNLHAAHRERVRERFLKSGLDGFADHNVLEFLLFYSIPRKDTNDLAHVLINTFGSLSAVFDATYEELLSVDGVGASTATLIKLFTATYQRYDLDKANSPYLDSTEKIQAYATSLFIGETDEKVVLLCFDNIGCLLNTVVLARGSKSSASYKPRTLMEAAFRCNATSVMLVHNHPRGFASPSPQDRKTTESLVLELQKYEIPLKDHLIVAGKECFSMANSKMYGYIFEPSYKQKSSL